MFANVIRSTLEFVGLKQTEEEKLHWDAVQQSIMVGRCQKQYNMSLARTNTRECCRVHMFIHAKK